MDKAVIETGKATMLVDRAQRALIDKIASCCWDEGRENADRGEIDIKIVVIRNELSGPNPSPLERLLVERIVADWLWLYYLEKFVAESPPFVGSYEEAFLQQKTIDIAHKRYLSSIKSLALVRKLALPVLLAQVNIAHKQQVNNLTLPLGKDVKPASDLIDLASPKNGE